MGLNDIWQLARANKLAQTYHFYVTLRSVFFEDTNRLKSYKEKPDSTNGSLVTSENVSFSLIIKGSVSACHLSLFFCETT